MDNLQETEQNCDVVSQFCLLQQNLTKLKDDITMIQQQLRVLDKVVKKEKKEEKKEKKPTTSTRQPKIVGFDILEPIRPELCVFMKLPPESKTTRNAATKYITEYISTNKLQDMTDRKRIHLNEELANLFQMGQADRLTYFMLHKYISLQFIR